MRPTAFSASGNSFGVHEWRGSGPATLHVHHSDDEAWHVLDGELTFRYSDRVESVGLACRKPMLAKLAFASSRRSDASADFLPCSPSRMASDSGCSGSNNESSAFGWPTTLFNFRTSPYLWSFASSLPSEQINSKNWRALSISVKEFLSLDQPNLLRTSGRETSS